MQSVRKSVLSLVVLAGSLAGGQSFAQQPTVEVLHYWTSGGESKAVAELKAEFEAAGGKWIDSPVAGGGGDAQATVLRSRVLAGDPPAAVQIKGPNISDWAKEGALADLSSVGAAEGWDKLLPPLLQGIVKFDGKYVAVPVNIHRVDWVWANPEVLKAAGVDGVPTTWEGMFEAAEKIKATGKIPFAHGGQPWQDATVFEAIVLGVGGAEFYNKALGELDEKALTSDTMKKAFAYFRKFRSYVDPAFPGRDWNLATAMVMNGQAGMQIMGDWAKGEFAAAGKVGDKDYICAPTPSKTGYILNSDSFAMFKVKGPDQVAGQALLAKLILGEKFQETFNLYKGSIPARIGVKRDKFDFCALKSMDDLKTASAAGTLVGSVAHEILQAGAVRGAFLDVVTEFFNSDMPVDEAVETLAEEMIAAKG
ncbi:MAG TPA: ABC transporter substrate-binding protein [Alphaproteobacteria bacterium]|nr:ABC transporter substrate-binding protein [Alphaproteobacteria bacterium]